MAIKKEKESFTIKKSTLIIGIVIIAVLLVLAVFYYKNNKTEEPKTKEIGSIETISIDVTAIFAKECKVCFNIQNAVNQIKEAPFIEVRQTNLLDASGREAKGLIKKYNVTKLPVLFLFGDVDKLPLKGFTKIENGSFLEDMPPPYVNLETRKIDGLVDVTYLIDNSCKKCYEVTQHKQIFELLFGVYLKDEEFKDISSSQGKQLIEKYKITKVPTVLLTPDVAKYQTVQSVWNTLGTVEEDGTHIFRNFSMTKGVILKDLKTNKQMNSTSLQEV